MKEIMVAYWSGTGNTAAMATILGKGIQDGGAAAKVVSVEDIKADDLKDYPVFALGCPSMGNETLEETVMEDFVTEVESFASGKKIGLFGSYGWGDGEWMRKNSIVDSALDGVGMGIGYTLTATLMATIREILGSGTWLGFQVIPESVAKVSIMTQAPGAFFCYGILMAGCIWLEGKLDARIERKSCCDLDNLKKEAE